LRYKTTITHFRYGIMEIIEANNKEDLDRKIQFYINKNKDLMLECMIKEEVIKCTEIESLKDQLNRSCCNR